MAIDPQISLDAGAGTANPLSVVETYADIQNKLNQNRLFQQQFAAKQKAGQIIAASPDLETGFTNMTKDPLVAPFAGEIISNYRQSAMFLTQQQGLIQDQSQSGLQAVLKGLTGGLQDPSMFDSIVKAQMATLSPSAKANVGPAVDAMRTALTAGLPKDPQAALAIYRKRLAATLIGSGVTPDAIAGVLGKPGQQTLGGYTRPTLQAPPQGVDAMPGGAIVGAPGAAANTLAPQIATTPGSVPVELGGGVPASAGGGNLLTAAPAPMSGPAAAPGGSGASGNALGGGAPVQSGRPNTAQPSVTPGAQPPAQGQPQAGDGKPLYSDPKSMISPYISIGPTGQRVMSDAQHTDNDELLKDFDGKEKEAFNNSQMAQASFTNMGNALDVMQHGGGFNTPGSLGTLRYEFSKMVNTLQGITGVKASDLEFSPDKLASIEEFNKDTKRLGAAVTSQFFGSGREAAQTIQSMTSSVPSIDNTYLGGKVVLDGLQAMNTRLQDERNYINHWRQINQGNISGAAEQFNLDHPARNYALDVLQKYGLTDKGFASPQAVGEAMQKGWIDRDTARAILTDQFKMGGAKAPAP